MNLLRHWRKRVKKTVMDIVKKIIGGYYFVGAIATYLIHIYLTGPAMFFYYIIPNIIGGLVYLFYTLVAFLYLKNPNKEYRVNLFMTVLILQSLQVEIAGYVFQNFYFPEAAFVINLKGTGGVFFEFSYYTLSVINGFFRDNFNNLIKINLFEIVVVIFIALLTSKRYKKSFM